MLGAEEESLQRQISRYTDLLDVLKKRLSFFERFKTWREVVDYLDPTILDSPQGDIALGGLIQIHQERHNPRWLTILTAVYWPLLEIIYEIMIDAVSLEQKITLWSDINWLFTKTINKPTLRERQARLSAKILNDIIHDLKYLTKAAKEENSRLFSLESEESLQDSRAVAVDDLNIQEVHTTWLLQKLKEHGQLDEIELHMLKATIIYNEPLVEYAGRLGLDYEFVKKRKQRAIKILKKLLIVCPQIKKKTPFNY